jgi:hypothetical protein
MLILGLGSKEIVPKSIPNPVTDKHWLRGDRPELPSLSAGFGFCGAITDSKDCIVWAVTELPSLLQRETKIDGNRSLRWGILPGAGWR